uniref:dolichyl-phosphate beta-glucosyltransferase n=1 Tax=Spongospora subterranea TaxID=70186 RepID=A0A0H5RA49_9EUKA|eukprot:CRZ11025.1 hypothetical protein [Spongospora subterranea]
MIAWILFFIFSSIVAYGLAWFFLPLYRSITVSTSVQLGAKYRTDKDETVSFTNVFEQTKPSVNLSVVVPAYNEEERMTIMLNETIRFLDHRRRRDPDRTFEVIIVNDGSKDKTESIAQSYTKANGDDVVRVLNLTKNSGKGAAVQAGMLHARGAYILMVDADGASRFSDLVELERAIIEVENDGSGIAIGSRAHLKQDAIAKRHWFRNFLMFGFHILVSTIAGVGIADTQCGFKLFTRNTARVLFANLHLPRWAFDVELIFMAGRLSVPMVEVPIHWTEIPGSKVSLLDGAITMLRDIIAIRICYMTGLWTIQPWREVYLLAKSKSRKE